MQINHQSVFEKWQIEDKSVQLICTSPPYFSLRKYQIPDVIIGGDKDCEHDFEIKDMCLGHENRQGKGSNSLNSLTESHIGVHGKKVGKQGFCIHCQAWRGQYGLEPDYKLYLEHTMLWLKEAWRVLRDDGVLFLNIADSYNSNSGGYFDKKPYGGMKKENRPKMKKIQSNCPSKSKLLIPERLMVMMADEGWIIRNHIVWFKPNGMPESCQDRFSKKWESIIFAVKNPKYYFNLDEIREPHAQVSIERLSRAVNNNNKWVMGADGQTKHGLSQPRENIKQIARGVEDEAEIKEYISNTPLQYKKRIGSMQSTEFKGGDYMVGKLNPKGKNPGDVWSIPIKPSPEKHYAMWPEKLVERMILCSTKAGDIVLDCFAGSGTTLRVAEKLNRTGKGIDLGYQDIQKRRLTEIQKELL